MDMKSVTASKALGTNNMTEISKSPERNTFQRDNHIKRAEEKGEEPNEAYLKMWEDWRIVDEQRIVDPTWQRNNMEYELRTCDWILEKVRGSDQYAQNLYAAICNNDFCKREMWPILKEEYWSASWRSAGGIVANMIGKGDYIDWYCSGIGNDEAGYGLDHRPANGYVGEGHVTDEIEIDLRKLGWMSIPIAGPLD